MQSSVCLWGVLRGLKTGRRPAPQVPLEAQEEGHEEGGRDRRDPEAKEKLAGTERQKQNESHPTLNDPSTHEALSEA